MATTNPLPARRGSLVGPVILVLLGLAFLINNLRPEMSLWSLAARYWPFLLIFWGLGRLAEYVVARFTSRPIANTLSGGEVFLVFLICLIGSGMFWWTQERWRPWNFRIGGMDVFRENYEFPVQASGEVPAGATVLIQNLYGNVRVIGSDGKEIKVTGRKTIRAFDRAAAEKADQDTGLQISAEKGRLIVRTNHDRLSGDRRISADLEVTMPSAAALRLEGRYGDWEVRDIAGPVEVSSSNAGVRLSNIAKDVRVELRRSDIVRGTDLKGNVEVSGGGTDIELEKIAGAVKIDGNFSGVIKLVDVAKPVRYTSSRTELSLERLPGRLELDSGSVYLNDVVGPLKLAEVSSRARSRDVRIDGFSKEVEISARRGDIELRTTKLPLASIKVETNSGNIRLALPAAAVFSIQGAAASGSAESEFGHTVTVEDRGKGHSAALKGGPAGAAAQIRLSTGRGDISVKKAS